MLLDRADQERERRTEIEKPAVSHRVLWPPPPPPPLVPQPRSYDVVRHETRYLGFFLLPLVISLAAVGFYFFLETQPVNTLDHEELMQLMTENRRASASPIDEGQSPDAGKNDFRTTLFVDSEPSGAQVLVDGDTVGATPVQLEDVAAGVYVLTIEKNRYASLDTVVFVDRDDPAPFLHFALNGTSPESFELQTAASRDFGLQTAASREHDRGTRSSPPVLNSDDRAEQTGEQRILAGVFLPSTGGDPQRQAARFERESDSNEATPLTTVENERPLPLGTLTVLVKPWGSIYVNDQLEKLNTDVMFTTALPIGRYVLRAEHPILGRREQVVEVRRERPLHVIFDLIEEDSAETESENTGSDAS